MKIAILGGTFDPIHTGHVAAAELVATTLHVDEVQFIPTFSPPHKPTSGLTPVFHRLAMVALATADNKQFKVSTIEADHLKPCYSVDTLQLMHERYPNSCFVFIIGTDMYEEIETWMEYKTLFELTSFAVINRPGFPVRKDIAPMSLIANEEADTLQDKPAVYYFHAPKWNISSSEIRKQLKNGDDGGHWMHPDVLAYIRKYKLYS